MVGAEVELELGIHCTFVEIIGSEAALAGTMKFARQRKLLRSKVRTYVVTFMYEFPRMVEIGEPRRRSRLLPHSL